MSICSQQEGFCQICGKPFKWLANGPWQNRCCSKPCWEEYKWREVLSSLGKSYRPKNYTTQPAVIITRLDQEPHGEPKVAGVHSRPVGERPVPPPAPPRPPY